MAPETAYVTGGQIASGGAVGRVSPDHCENTAIAGGFGGSTCSTATTAACTAAIRRGSASWPAPSEGFRSARPMPRTGGITVAGGGNVLASIFRSKVPGLPAQPGAGGGGVMSTADVATGRIGRSKRDQGPREPGRSAGMGPRTSSCANERQRKFWGCGDDRDRARENGLR